MRSIHALVFGFSLFFLACSPGGGAGNNDNNVNNINNVNNVTTSITSIM
ncbi:hypothetical protein KJ865_12580 [Myxococcota bacterium]|nr:hypothetical protein [Myxococcota bacterium]